MDTTLEKLIASYQKKLALEPANAFKFSQLADFYYTQGKFSDAMLACQQALQLQPNLATSLILEKVLSAIGKTDADSLRPKPGIANWIEIDAELVANYPDAINQIYKCELDGLVIKRVFSQEEMTEAIYKLEGKKDAMIPTPFGEVFGYPHTKIEDEIKYFRELAWLRHELNNILGGDFEARFQAIIRKISGERTVDILGEDTDKKYALANIRVYQPNKGGLRPHADQEFIELNDPYGYQLRQIAKSTKCMLSYFLLLNKSEAGGDLIVYDHLWEQTPPELKAESTTEERQNFVSKFQKKNVKVDVGDVVIFNARRIWHRISDIKGKTNRVTVGGRISISMDDRQVFYWS